MRKFIEKTLGILGTYIMDTENFETIDEYYIERENKNADFYDCLKWLLIAVVLIACYHLVLYAAGYEVTSKYKSMALAQQSSEPADFIIGPCELQEMLNQIEPENPIKVDGHIGPATIAKWNRVWFNQCAAKTFKVTKVKSD